MAATRPAGPARSALLLLLPLALAGPSRADDDEPPIDRREYDVSALLGKLEEQPPKPLGLVRYHDTEQLLAGQVLDFEEAPDESSWFRALELERWLTAATNRGGELRRGRLACELAAPAHQRTLSALRLMRREARPLACLTVEVVALTPEQTRALEGGAGATLDEAARAALAQARRAGRLGTSRLLLRDGEQGTLAILERTTFLGDHEVNQTGVIPVLNPIVEQLACGLSVNLALARVPGGEGQLILDARVERAERDPVLREVSPPAGGRLQLPAIGHLALASTVVARVGETVLLGALETPDAEVRPGPRETPRVLAVICRVDPVGHLESQAVDPAAAGPFLRRYALRAVLPAAETCFLRPVWSEDLSPDEIDPAAGQFQFQEDFEGAPPEGWDPDQLADQVMSEAAQGTWEDPDSGCWVEARGQALIVSQTAAGHAAVEAFLRREALSLRRVQYELLVLDAPEPAEGGEPIPPLVDAATWAALCKAHPVRERALVAGQSGQHVEALLRREMRLFTQVECGAGGCEAVVKTVADPIVTTSVRGVHLAIRGRVDDQGGVGLEIDADLRRGGSLDSVETSEGTFDREVGVECLRLRQEVQLEAGQGLAWELGTGPARRLLLVRARAIAP